MAMRSIGNLAFCAAISGALLNSSVYAQTTPGIHRQDAIASGQVYVCVNGQACPSEFLGILNRGTLAGEWWVVDSRNDLVWHYNVTRNGSGGAVMQDLGVDSGTQAYVNAEYNMYKAAHNSYYIALWSYQDAAGTWHLGNPDGTWPQVATGIHPNAGGGPVCPAGSQNGRTNDGYWNAYDTISNVQAEETTVNALNVTVNSLQSDAGMFPNQFYNAVAEVLAAIPGSKIKLPDYVLRITMQFHDTSWRIYQYNGATNSYEPVSGTARDCNGNLIPEDRRMVAGVPPLSSNLYHFQINSVDYWNGIKLLQSYNIPVHPTVTVDAEYRCTMQANGQPSC